MWLNNSRGTRHSRSHRYYCPEEDLEFWDYSFYEMGKYDQPALMEYVLEKSGVEKLTYVGHSQGTSQIFSALHENTEFFRKRVNLFIMLAPVARIDHTTVEQIHKLKENQRGLDFLTSMGPELFSAPGTSGSLMSGFMKVTGGINITVKIIADDDPLKISQTAVEQWMGHAPAGTSFKCVDHFRQNIVSK